MAKFQYGAIITRISGSIGGTNFRLYRGMPVISNKSQGFSRSILLSNSRLAQIAHIRRAWAALLPNPRKEWTDLSSRFQFPDKFGNLRTLTGQQFFNKINCQLSIIPRMIYNAAECNVSIGNPTFNSFVINTNSNNAVVSFSNILEENYFLFQAQIFKKTPTAVVFNRKKIIYSTVNNEAFTADMYKELQDYVGPIDVGNTVRLFYCNMSLGGLRSPWQVYDTIVLP